MFYEGGSPGLVVMGEDSCSEGRGFKSQLSLLDGHSSHIFVAKNCNKNKSKEAWDGPFFKKMMFYQ